MTPTRFYCASAVLIVASLSHSLAAVVKGDTKLTVAYEWSEVDFAYDAPFERAADIADGEFIPANVLPLGMDIVGDRMFVTLPRWKAGVPASLAYFNMSETTTKSPLLRPYPNWDAHGSDDPNVPAEIISPFRIRADRCGRLWVLDTGVSDILNDTKVLAPPSFLVYDLKTDKLIRRFAFAKDQYHNTSFFATLAVEDGDCDNTFAYAADLSPAGLIVYSWKSNETWRVHHNYFDHDPKQPNFTISTIDYSSDGGIFGLALSEKQADGFATLYFHPFSSTAEFSVSTRILRDKQLAADSKLKSEYKRLGSRGPTGQATASFTDLKSGVLFYALIHLDAIACWNPASQEHSIPTQGRIFTSHTEMVFPNELRIDEQDRLWVLSDNMHEFEYGHLDPKEINYRILTGSVQNAIKDTPCDIKAKAN